MDKRQQILDRIKQLPADKQAILFEQLNQMETGNEITPIIDGKNSPASFSQEGLWNIYEIEGANDKYNMPSAYQLNKALNADALQKSFAEVVERHQSLRTYFQKIDNDLYQMIADSSEFKVDYIDLTELEEQEQTNKTYQYIEKSSKHIFRLEQGPLFIVSLLKIATDFHILLMNAHHIIFDGWSKGVLLKEVFALYDHYQSDSSTESSKVLPKLSIQFKDFAYWERQQPYIDEQINYWVNKLKGAPHLIDIGDKQRQSITSNKGYAVPLKLSRQLSQSILNIGRQQGASAFMTMLTTFSILLSRYAQQKELLIGTPIDNRNRQELRDLIGYFLNTTVLRIAVDEQKSFSELLARVRDICTQAYSNQEAPFNKVVEAVNPIRSLSISPLFQVMFVFQVAGASDFRLPGLDIKQIDNEKIDLQQMQEAELDLSAKLQDGKFVQFESHSKYDLYLTFIEENENDGLSGWLTYNADIFSQSHIKQLLQDYVSLLEQLANKPDMPVYQMHAAHCKQQNISMDETACKSIAHYFELQAKQTPHNLALQEGDKELSYAELNAQANQLARYLQYKNVQVGDVLCLIMHRCKDMILSMLAAYKLGAAYLPLDPELPITRITSIIDDANPAVIISKTEFLSALDGIDNTIVDINQELNNITEQAKDNLDIMVAGEIIAYYLYTSGSTGLAKGVMATHKATLNRLQWMWREYPYRENEVLCHKTTCSFVDSVAEIWSPLLKGQPLVIIPQESVVDLFEFINSLKQHKITRLTLVPSLLLAMLDHFPELSEELPDLSLVVCSGEMLQEDLVKRFHEAFDKAVLLNLYGSTEVAADASFYQVPRQDKYLGGISIGDAIDNTQLYVLDAYLNPCPIGVKGELFIGGLPVSLGYANDPKLSAEKFIPNIFTADGSRMFRTHDKVRRNHDGSLQYLGRQDNQIKIRGFRINLDEIKQALSQHIDIKDVAIIDYTRTSGDVILIAYLVPEDHLLADFKADSVRSYLRDRLPDYMVPGHYEILPELPLLENGKLDKHNLPEADFEAHQNFEYIAAESETEQTLLEIWKNILQIDKIGISNNFFDLGGHSILATKLVVMIRDKFNVEIKVQDVFSLLTIRELAKQIDNMRNIKQLFQESNAHKQNEKDEIEVIEF